jgi:uncharacterized membrane protein
MVGFVAYVFDGKKTAAKALDTLEDNTPAYAWIDNVAVVSKSKHGHLNIRSTWAQDDMGEAGMGWGALTGGLLGLLAGPGGALAGAAMGGSLWGLMGATMDLAFDDPALDDFASSLTKDTSALVLVGADDVLADYEGIVAPFGGKLIKTNLTDDDVKKIKKALASK